MKTSIFKTTLLSIMLSLGFILVSQGLMAQNEIIRESRDLPAFDQLDIGSAFDVNITFGEPQKVEVETKQKLIHEIITEVKNGKFTASSSKVRSNTPMSLFITIPGLKQIGVHAAAELKATNTLTADMLEINVSGAAEATLPVDVQTLRSTVSGAAELKLSGKAESHSTDVSGAATLDARKLITQNTDANVSGAATARLNSEQITGKTSGAGEIITEKSLEIGEGPDKVIIRKEKKGDTTYIRVPGKAVIVSEGDDSIKVIVGNRMVVIDEDGNVRTSRCKDRKFNGHWAGVDIGFNGYVTPDFNMNFPKEFEYMDLRMEKSVVVNLNFFEQNIALAKNQKWGMLTGLGMTFNNYHFMRQTRLSMDSSQLIGYLDQDISIRKSKLTAMYLTLPVLFEFQTAPCYYKNGFHISTGMIIGARLTSHTKKYYNELNKDFEVTRYNPAPGIEDYQVEYYGTSPDHPKTKQYGDWFLQPFKFDATVRVGWNFLNFWATYSVNSMFRKEKGPELYPWSAGITLVCF